MSQAETQKLQITPMGGEAIQSLLTKLYATPKPIIETAKMWSK